LARLVLVAGAQGLDGAGRLGADQLLRVVDRRLGEGVDGARVARASELPDGAAADDPHLRAELGERAAQEVVVLVLHGHSTKPVPRKERRMPGFSMKKRTRSVRAMRKQRPGSTARAVVVQARPSRSESTSPRKAPEWNGSRPSIETRPSSTMY